jgi:ArsR family transcriptional regulator
VEDVYRDLGVLSEPARVRLLSVLQHHELGTGELTRILQLPQSTVSRHLKALRVAGWVHRRAEGTAAWFRAAPELDPLAHRLWAVVREAFHDTHQHREDQLRLQAALASREADSFFGRMSDRWDALRSDLFGDSFLLPALVALLPSSLEVVDLGCGTGPAVEALSPAVRSVIGVDREPAMIAAARRRLAGATNVDLRQGGLEALPLSDGEVDAATCILVLHHVADLPAAFAEIRRVLRPDGRLVVVDMVAHDRSDWRHTMGHRHLGFEQQALEGHARTGGLVGERFQLLPPAPDAQGPPLFVATFRPRAPGAPTR